MPSPLSVYPTSILLPSLSVNVISSRIKPFSGLTVIVTFSPATAVFLSTEALPLLIFLSTVISYSFSTKLGLITTGELGIGNVIVPSALVVKSTSSPFLSVTVILSSSKLLSGVTVNLISSPAVALFLSGVTVPFAPWSISMS